MHTAVPGGLLTGTGTRPFSRKSTDALFRSVVWRVAERAGLICTKDCSCHNGGTRSFWGGPPLLPAVGEIAGRRPASLSQGVFRTAE